MHLISFGLFAEKNKLDIEQYDCKLRISANMRTLIDETSIFSLCVE